MGLELCPDCKKMHYTTNPCAQIIAKKSTAARKDVFANGSSSDGAAGIVTPTERVRLPVGHGGPEGPAKPSKAGTQALPVDANAAQESYGAEGLRPDEAPAKFDKKAWMRSKMPAYMRQYRADVKAGLRVPKPKASKPIQ